MTQFTDEEKQQIEQEFRNSWDRIHEFYADLLSFPGWEDFLPLLDVIFAMEARGYNNHLRAGTAMSTSYQGHVIMGCDVISQV